MLTRIRSLVVPVAVLAVIAAGGANAAPAMATPHVGNPFVGARPYVNPDWAARVSAQATATGGDLGAKMARVANQPTAIWLDRIGAVDGLRRHLDLAAARATARTPVVVPIVLYNLPNRTCWRRSQTGELTVTGGGTASYRTDFIDPVAGILADPKYARLRLVVVVEPLSLLGFLPPPEFQTQACTEARVSGAYVDGVRYALSTLDPIRNVYLYLDAGYSAEHAYPDYLATYTDLLATIAAGRTGAVDGFVSNVAQYVPLDEPFLDSDSVRNGQPIQWSRFYDWNPTVDELEYAELAHAALRAKGFRGGIVVDTSRNGWGGPRRPTGPSVSIDLNTWVDQTKVDRRPVRSWWCNQAGAGLGERYRVAPAPHLQAYLWLKPPGESDGYWTPLDIADKDPQCQPDAYWPPDRGTAWPTNALPLAPPPGDWFPSQFDELVRNAYPAL